MTGKNARRAEFFIIFFFITGLVLPLTYALVMLVYSGWSALSLTLNAAGVL